VLEQQGKDMLAVMANPHLCITAAAVVELVARVLRKQVVQVKHRP
jgi:hypothetical protein